MKEDGTMTPQEDRYVEQETKVDTKGDQEDLVEDNAIDNNAQQVQELWHPPVSSVTRKVTSKPTVQLFYNSLSVLTARRRDTLERIAQTCECSCRGI